MGLPQMSDKELEMTSLPNPKGRAGQLFPAPQAENCFGKCSALCRGFLGFHLQRPELNCSLGHKKINVVVSKSPADVWEITELNHGERFKVAEELLGLIQRQTQFQRARFILMKTSSTNTLESKDFLLSQQNFPCRSKTVPLRFLMGEAILSRSGNAHMPFQQIMYK